MQLTAFTDYGFRVLIYLGRKKEWATIEEISSHYKISKHHLVKVAHQLAKKGFIQSAKGRNGGIRLVRAESSISLSEVVIALEPNMNLVECFDREHNTCPMAGSCELENVLYQAKTAFINSLKNKTLEDVV